MYTISDADIKFANKKFSAITHDWQLNMHDNTAVKLGNVQNQGSF